LLLKQDLLDYLTETFILFTMTNNSIKVLLVEDNPLDSRLIREIMKASHSLTYAFEAVDTLALGLDRLNLQHYDAALLDLSLPDSEGMNTFLEIHKRAPDMPVIILTGMDDEGLALEAMQQGAQDYLVKGQLNRNHLERALTYALERHKILDELQKSRQSLQATTLELEKALQSIHQELETAKIVQKAFLPQDIYSIPGVEIGVMFVPCGTVGGDLYDVIPIDDSQTAFLLLDVAGHGIPAALIAAMAKLSFARNIKKGLSPKEIFQIVNKELINYLPSERFITAILCVFDASSKQLSLARAGNPPALLLRASSNTVEQLTPPGTFIGVFPDGKFEQIDLPLSSGDRLLLYTDGLVECTDSSDKQFGRTRLSELFLQTRTTPADETTVHILMKTKAYVGDGPQQDDITFLVLEIG
jgi:serine phosphatase RsbU (regulator of sigma subunit)